MPPNPRNRGSGRVSQHIPPVADRVCDQMRSRDFAQETPDDEVQSDLTPGRPAIVFPPTEPALRPQYPRQGGRNQQQVVKVIAHETASEMRQHDPAVQRVESDREEAKPIQAIAPARPHNSAKIKRPESAASPSLPRKTIMPRRLVFWRRGQGEVGRPNKTATAPWPPALSRPRFASCGARKKIGAKLLVLGAECRCLDLHHFCLEELALVDRFEK